MPKACLINGCQHSEPVARLACDIDTVELSSLEGWYSVFGYGTCYKAGLQRLTIGIDSILSGDKIMRIVG